jgi:membrane protein
VTATERPTLSVRLRAWFFDGALPERPLALVLAALGARIIGLSALRFHRDRGQEKAASLAYATLLALLPVLVLAISLIEFLAPAQQNGIAERLLTVIFPEEATDLRKGILDYVESSRHALQGSASAGTGLRIAGAVMLIYFAANLMTGVDRVVGDIWGTGSIRVFMRRLTAYWAVGTIGPLLLALSIAGTAVLRTHFGESAGGFATAVLPFLMTWGCGFAFFRLMPHTSTRTTAALAGAGVAGVLWEGTKLAMGWYLAAPKSLLTALSFFPAAILWMYVSWAIAIFGMEVTYVVHHGSWRPGRRAGVRDLTGRARDELVLGTAVTIARAFNSGKLLNRADLAEALCAGEDEVMVALKALRDAGLVVADESGGYRPSRGAGGIAAVELVDSSRGKSCKSQLPESALHFLAALNRDGRTAVSHVTLEDLVRETPPVSEGAGCPPDGG